MGVQKVISKYSSFQFYSYHTTILSGECGLLLTSAALIILAHVLCIETPWEQSDQSCIIMTTLIRLLPWSRTPTPWEHCSTATVGAV